MEYTIKVNEVKGNDSNVRGFATVVFGDSFKVTNIAILENREKNQLFVSMPRYKSNEVDEHGVPVYKDVCNPITKEFREELYGAILERFRKAKEQEEEDKGRAQGASQIPKFSVTVTPFEREGSNVKGLARVFLDDCFIINNITLLQGKDKMFVAMPSYRTKQVNEQGKPVYQDVCYPVTKEFREKLYGRICDCYSQEISKNQHLQRMACIEEKYSDLSRSDI